MKHQTIIASVLIAVTSVLLAQGALPDEVYFRVENTSTSFNFLAYSMSQVLDRDANLTNLYNSVFTNDITENSPDMGFNFPGSENSDSPVIGFGLYRITTADEPFPQFYYDLRDCNYILSNGWSGSPDVVFIYETRIREPNVINYRFWNWPNGVQYEIEEGDTISLSWAQLPPDVVANTNPKYLPNITNYGCYYADIQLINRIDETDVTVGQFYIPSLDEYITSGETVSLRRGYLRSFIAQEEIVYNEITNKHHNWMVTNDPVSLEYVEDIDDDLTLYSLYLQQANSVITSSAPIPISIQDPWYVDGSGNQTNGFHELNDTENTAYVMYEQGQLLESLPDSLNGQGKLLALPAPEEIYQKILNDYPNSQAAELVRMGRIESEDSNENDIIPESFTLYPAYPNPFNPITTIKYDLPSDSRINLTVYNIMGQEINKLTDGTKQAGVHTIKWNGTNSQNKTVSSGMYLVKMTTPNSVLTQKLVLMK